MKISLVSGDGLPVSGLLTIFRNVVSLGTEAGLLAPNIPVDFGYSWRPDKSGYFPRGSPSTRDPEWLTVSSAVPWDEDPDEMAKEMIEIRNTLANDCRKLDTNAELGHRIEKIAKFYEAYFDSWLAESECDWLWALNMTISDAVPVTLALHRSARRYWADRPGGVLFWDHDLFGSYAVHDLNTRVYPKRPSELTPIPGSHRSHRWVVVSRALADEARTYDSPIVPDVVPNVLPFVPKGPLEERHLRFLDQLQLTPHVPVVLAPVRVFHVKGLETSIALVAHMRKQALLVGCQAPVLLIFGSLSEEPSYAAYLEGVARKLDVLEAVHFLDGVPLQSTISRTGSWLLDEIDLLRICKANGGAVVFTPNRPDVESVGLGPALSTVAGVPCAVTKFHAFDEIYGPQFSCVTVRGDGDLSRAADELLRFMVRTDSSWSRIVSVNRQIVDRAFPVEPWRKLLHEMEEARLN